MKLTHPIPHTIFKYKVFFVILQHISLTTGQATLLVLGLLLTAGMALDIVGSNLSVSVSVTFPVATLLGNPRSK